MSKVKDEVILGLTANAYLPPTKATEQPGAAFSSHIPLEHWKAEEIEITQGMLEQAKERLEARGIYVPEISSGFSAHLYIAPGTDGSRVPVIAYRGTDGLTDGPADGALGLGVANSQIANALLFYEAAKQVILEDKSLSESDLIFTGHSLGGGLAGMMAAYTGHEALTVNSAPNGLISEAARHGLYVKEPSYTSSRVMDDLGAVSDVLNIPEETRRTGVAALGYVALKHPVFALGAEALTRGLAGPQVGSFPENGQMPDDFKEWYIPPSSAPFDPSKIRQLVFRGELLDHVNQDIPRPALLGHGDFFPQPYYAGNVTYTHLTMDGKAGLGDLHSAYLENLAHHRSDILAPLAAAVPELVTELFNQDANRVKVLNGPDGKGSYRSDTFIQQLIRDDFMKGPMSLGFISDLNKIAEHSSQLSSDSRRALLQGAIQFAALEGPKGASAANMGVIDAKDGALSIDVSRYPTGEPLGFIQTLRNQMPENSILPAPQRVVFGAGDGKQLIIGSAANEWFISGNAAETIIPMRGKDVVLGTSADNVITDDKTHSMLAATAVASGDGLDKTLDGLQGVNNELNGNRAAQQNHQPIPVHNNMSSSSMVMVAPEKSGTATGVPTVSTFPGYPIEQVLPSSHRSMAPGADEMGSRSEIKRIAVERTGLIASDPRNDIQTLLNENKWRPMGHLLILADGTVQGPEQGAIPFENNPRIAAGKNGETLGVMYAGQGEMNHAQAANLAKVSDSLRNMRFQEGLPKDIEIIAGSTGTAEILNLPTPRGPLASTAPVQPTPQLQHKQSNGMGGL